MLMHSAAIVSGMSREGEIDYQREAEAAMKMAAATSGFERLKWVQVAQAWQGLGRYHSLDGRISAASHDPSKRG